MAYGYITKLNENVEREHVRYYNRFGIMIAGDLYYAKDIDKTQKYPALIVGAPYGGTKEQGPCVYANELAQRGFIVLTFDQVFMGESGGEVRNVSDPSMFSESFSAGVDFLGVKVPFVEREKIGVIGICGSGGFALNAAQADTRIKAVATAAMYDITNESRKMFTTTPEAVLAAKEKMSQQRWNDYENGQQEYNMGFPEEPMPAVPEGLPEPYNEFFSFYGTKRGHHPNARGGFTTISTLSMMNFRLFDYIDEISPRPILFITGDRAHSKFFTDDANAAAKEPKEVIVVEDCNHVDLYDNVDKIPFDKLENFFKKAFN